MDAAVMIPILLSLTSLGLWFHGIVSLIKFIVEIKLYMKDKANKGNMVTLNLTNDQFILIKGALDNDFYYCLEQIGIYTSPEHFNEDEAKAFIKQRDDINELLKTLETPITGKNM